MPWETLMNGAFVVRPQLTNAGSHSAISINDLCHFPPSWPMRNSNAVSNADRTQVFSNPEAALQQVQKLEAQHNAVLEQIAALQQHSQDLQSQEQSLTAVLLNEMSHKLGNSSNPIQAFLQQVSVQGDKISMVQPTHIWPGHNQNSLSPAYSLPSQDESLLLFLHHQRAVMNHQVGFSNK